MFIEEGECSEPLFEVLVVVLVGGGCEDFGAIGLTFMNLDIFDAVLVECVFVIAAFLQIEFFDFRLLFFI